MTAGEAPRFLRACRRRPVDATPVWFMRQAGRYLPEYRRLRRMRTLLELCERPELAAEATLQPVRRFPVDAAILFADILLPLKAMGMRLAFLKGEGPSLSPPIRSRQDAARLRELNPEEDLPHVLETVRLVRRELASSAPRGRAPTPLIGFAGAPFTLASYAVEGGPSGQYLRTKALMHSDPAAWNLLMGKLRRATARYLLAQVAAGAQAVQLFDSWAGCLSREDYVRFVQPHTRAVLGAVRAAGVPAIHFGTGVCGFLEEFRDAGGDVVGVDWRMPLDRAWRRLGARAVQGNLDPALLARAPRPELRRAVREILARAEGRPGHVFNLGHGVLPSTPVDSVRAVADWVHEGLR